VRLSRKVEIEIALAAVVVAAALSGFLAYNLAKGGECLYPTKRSIALLNLFGKVVAVPPGEPVSGEWGEAYYEPKCNSARLEVSFKSGLKLAVEGMPDGSLKVVARYQNSTCEKEIKALPTLPYIVITASLNRVLVSAYGKVLVIDMAPELKCSIAMR